MAVCSGGVLSLRMHFPHGQRIERYPAERLAYEEIFADAHRRMTRPIFFHHISQMFGIDT